jgi:phosphatidate cytidylyltransferase
MNVLKDPQMLAMFIAVFGMLSAASTVCWILLKRTNSESTSEMLKNLTARIKAWWVMIGIFLVAVSTGGTTSLILFMLISFLALREFVTLTPTRRADHRVLFWVFFVVLPINYYLLAIHWYGMFTIFVPVYAFLWIPIRSALAGDSKDFLMRNAEIQWGLMVCVYFLSYAPALLSLSIPGYGTQTAKLLCFFVFVVQVSDVMQYVFGKCFGKHKIVPEISPNKTVEGFVGGILSAVALGTCFWWMTPFAPWQAALMALVISLMGFGGGIVMSAIKRDRGLKDYGTLIPGHGGMIDRIDSLCFAAPIFFHLTRFFFAH